MVCRGACPPGWLPSRSWSALAVEALPAWGADFGGPPGLLLGGLVVIASAAGVRLTWGRVLVAVVGAGALAAVVAVLDWLRPPESRTHLGEFVQSVVSGEAGAVVGRKLAQNVANLASPPLLAIAMATVVLVVVAWRTGWRPVDAGAAVLRGAAVMAVVAFLVNDSGLVIPAFVALVLAPLLVAAGPAPATFTFAPERKWREPEGSGIGRESCGESGGSSAAGSTSSTRMPPASLGWMKFTRELLVPRFASG